MKYFSLVWAALRRKTVRTIATFFSVAVAFILFGLMIGLDATMERMAQLAHADRLWTNPRFNTSGMPIAMGRQVAALPGVKKASVMSYLGGYVGDPKNQVGMTFVDDAYGIIFPDQVPPDQAELVRRNRGGVVLNRSQAKLLRKKVGDHFTIIAQQPVRADGTKNWLLTVVGIYEDIPQFPGPQIWGNYDYFDKSRPLSDQGKIDEVDTLTTDPAMAPALATRIDAMFANSSTPTRSMTEKQAYAVGGNGGGIDIEALTRKIAAVGLLMIFLLTANVIAQSVRERSAEFATLKTFGFSSGHLMILVMVEAAIPCLVGAVGGVALAGLLAPHVQDVMPPNYGIPAPTMSAGVFLWAMLCAVCLAFASAALPVWRLGRMDIASVLSRQA